MKNKINDNASVLILFYADIQGFPPTINLINFLKKKVKNIILVNRSQFLIDFGKNVQIQSVGRKYSVKDQMHGSYTLKAYLYLKFIILTFKSLYFNKPNIVIVIDPVALFLYRVVNFFSFRKSYLWYHNHDVLQPSQNIFHLNYWVSYIERISFKDIDMFTLPSIERLIYFPINKLKGEYFVLPNYPSLEFYNDFYNKRTFNQKEFNIIYQGTISENHGIEEVMYLLGYNSEINKTIILNLKGRIDSSYKNYLFTLATKLNCLEYLRFHDYTTYSEVPVLASKCQLGIAIFKSNDIMNSTLGSASNKIYEYAAVGTPVIYLKKEHFISYLNERKWAFSTDLSLLSLINIVKSVNNDFVNISFDAYNDFQNDFNFEKMISKII